MTSHNAFTLAEVLITLAIIGVVAAMTIPTLVANYQTKAWNTSATVFERKLTEALKVMNTQATLAGYSTTEGFVDELSKHLKITKICSNDKLLDCFSDKVFWGGGQATPEEVDMNIIKTAKNFGQNNWGTNIVGTQFANGTTALIAYNPACSQDPYSNQITGGDCLAILYDTTGYKTPNTSGKDLRANSNVAKLGRECALEIDGNCYSSPFLPSPLAENECELKKAELGINECFSYDYWGGAVAACGGSQNLPTSQEASKINAYFNTFGDNENEMLEAFGFDLTLIGYDNVLIWGSHEQNDDDRMASNQCAEWHIINGGGRVGYCDYRSSNDVYAICKY